LETIQMTLQDYVNKERIFCDKFNVLFVLFI